MNANNDRDWELVRAEAGQLRRLAPKADGCVALCWSPGKHNLPLALALAGFLVVALEDTPEEAAKLMEKASAQHQLSSFQIYVRTPERVIAESLDLYHLVAVGAEQAMEAPPHVITGLCGRLAGGGVFCACRVPVPDTAAVTSKLRAAGIEGSEGAYPQGCSPAYVWEGLLRRRRTTVNLVFRRRE